MNLNEPTEGRWLTPDLLGGDITNPQSLNRYAYALNNPTTLTDPSGLCPPCRFKLPMPLPSPGIDEFGYAYPDVLGPEGWEGSALSFGGFAFATSWGYSGFGGGGWRIGGIYDGPANLSPPGPVGNQGCPVSPDSRAGADLLRSANKGNESE
ncbi:MAG TPA: RHS repeat-associated core domain-containing protein [Terriglobia bacterium]|nr:RHS repeat-associated core domain-containing protein [Terriglobia bacterium]